MLQDQAALQILMRPRSGQMWYTAFSPKHRVFQGCAPQPRTGADL